MIQRNRMAWLVAIFFTVLPGIAAAEPISFEQAANVTGKGGVEVGMNFDYSVNSIQNQGLGTTYDQTLLDLPFYIRAGISAIEAQLTVPYGSVVNSYNSAVAGDSSFRGLKDIGLMVKSNFIQLQAVSLAVGFDTVFPTGDASQDLGEGQNFTPFVAADVDMRVLRLHGNLGYQVSGKYTTTTDPASHNTIAETEVQPGNAVYWALGAELPLMGDFFSLNAELLGAQYGPEQFNGTEFADSTGSTVSFVPGVRLNLMPLRAKLGLELPLENESTRPSTVARGDWRLIGGVSLQFSMGSPNPNSAEDNPPKTDNPSN